jgi:3-dehydroquinate synthetase
LLELVHRDKKVTGGAPRWILPVGLGRAVISQNVTAMDLIEVFKRQSS